MTKEKLMEWGLTEEQANKVMEGLNGSFVTKSRFNEVNEENKTLVITRNFRTRSPPFRKRTSRRTRITPMKSRP